MAVSSRTPEGDPLQCPLCGRTVRLELCEPLRDATCPTCGQLLTWLAHRQGHNIERFQNTNQILHTLESDSLELVELIMELEDHFAISVPDSVYEKICSPRDAFRTISKLIEENPPP